MEIAGLVKSEELGKRPVCGGGCEGDKGVIAGDMNLSCLWRESGSGKRARPETEFRLGDGLIRSRGLTTRVIEKIESKKLGKDSSNGAPA